MDQEEFISAELWALLGLCAAWIAFLCLGLYCQ